jgi:ABC-type transporter Mla subunit MlaD
MTNDLGQLTQRLEALTSELRQLVHQHQELASEQQGLLHLCSSLQREYAQEVDRTLHTLIEERTESYQQTVEALQPAQAAVVNGPN